MDDFHRLFGTLVVEGAGADRRGRDLPPSSSHPRCRWARAPRLLPLRPPAVALAGGCAFLPEPRSRSWVFGPGPLAPFGDRPNGQDMRPRRRHPRGERIEVVSKTTTRSSVFLGAPPTPRLSGRTASLLERSLIFFIIVILFFFFLLFDFFPPDLSVSLKGFVEVPCFHFCWTRLVEI